MTICSRVGIVLVFSVAAAGLRAQVEWTSVHRELGFAGDPGVNALGATVSNAGAIAFGAK